MQESEELKRRYHAKKTNEWLQNSFGVSEREMPLHNNTDTSIEAAESIMPFRGRDQFRIYLWIESQEAGATCCEVERALSMAHQTASARINDLLRANRVFDTGDRRKTKSGRPARVYKVVDREGG